MPIRRPDPGCHGYSSSRNSVPWAFSSFIVQHKPTALEPQWAHPNRVCSTPDRGRPEQTLFMNEGKSESRSDDPAVSLPAIAGRPARFVPVIAVTHRELHHFQGKRPIGQLVPVTPQCEISGLGHTPDVL